MRGPARFDLGQLRARMEAVGVDAVIASSFENVYYASGTLIMTQRTVPERLALAIFPRRGDPTLVVCNIEESLSRAESWISDVRAYVEFAQAPLAMLAEVLRERELDRGRLGVEMRSLTAAHFEELGTLVPRAEFVTGDELFHRLRVRKSEREVEHLQRIANITERVVHEVFTGARSGETEQTLAARMSSALLAAGAESAPFCVLSSGENARYAHNPPGPRTVRAGDVIRVDVGGQFDGYFSDLARMAVVGRPSRRQHETYRRLREVQRDTINRMRPGVPAADVFAHCKRQFAAQGLAFRMPHIGHSLGIVLHEEPMIQPYNAAPLEPGMVINIEPLYVDADAAYHLEDLVLVTDGDPVILSDAVKTDEMVVVQ